MPVSVHRITLLSTVISFASLSPGPNLPPLRNSYLASRLTSSQSSASFGPTLVKSSPCTLVATFLSVCTNTQGLAVPCTKPIDFRKPEYSCCHPSAAALVPYMCFFNKPHMPLLKSSCS